MDISKIQLENQVYDIKDSTARSQLIQINEKIPSLEKNAIYFGNSYTTGVGSTSGTDGLFNLTKDLFNNAYSFTGSGTGFLAHADHENDTFLTQLQRAINTASIDKSSITDIIIIGAWGDSAAYNEFGKESFSTQIRIAVQSFVNTVKQNYPNVNRISYIWAEGRRIQYPNSAHPSTLSDEFNIHNLFKNLLPRYGMSYLGWIGFNITLRNNYFTSDNVHPNDEGYQILSNCFKACYCGNLVYQNIRKTLTAKSCPITENSTMNSIIILTPDSWFLCPLSINLKTGSTPAFNTVIDLIDFSNEDFCLPIPFNTQINLGLGFTVQTTSPNGNNFNTNNAYISRIEIRQTTDLHSTRITSTNFTNAKTVASELGNAIVTPNLIFCDLEYK